ncbi:MAG: tetratricopeptide repeat protein, partial [Planctomycetaceae bacterium]|nr:tetratricopeptide repeat protein [Planctomycetaceae bacterium]
RPRAAVAFEVVAKLNYEDAMSQSEQAIASREWDKAIVLLKQAIRKADPAKEPEKANLARYKLAYCLYMVKQYYEAEVLAEHLARRYPRFSLAAKATEIGMASLADAYNTYREIDRGSDLNHLIELARYTVETWPDNDPADVARMTLGQIYQGMGRYPEAIAVYEAIRPDASQWVEGQTGAGATHWQYSLALRGSDKVAEADAEVAKALADLNAALKARRHAGATLTDPGLINNACDIADVHLETGKPSEALTLLEPIGKARQGTSGPAFGRLMSTLLRAHVSDGHVDQALADMAALEAAGGAGDSLTQLYFGLGKLLQKEIDRLKQSGDSVGLNKTQQAYQKFLSALASSKTGQTYDSLQWAGENMLTLNDAKEAADVFNRILATFGQDQAFLAQPGGKTRIFRTRLKLVAALRGQRDFTAAEALVDELLKENPGAFKPIMVEKAQLSEDRAVAGSGNWDVAYNRWEKLARKLEQMRPKPIEYFDAWYHAALALSMEKKTTLAKQILASVMRLSPTVGGPEMKAKYVELLSKLK